MTRSRTTKTIGTTTIIAFIAICISLAGGAFSLGRQIERANGNQKILNGISEIKQTLSSMDTRLNHVEITLDERGPRIRALEQEVF